MNNSDMKACPMTRPTIGALKTSLYWQEHLVQWSSKPEQRERARAAAERLRQQIAELEKANDRS